MPRARILLVHDDVCSTERLRRVLQGAKYDVPAPAASIDEAIKMAGSGRPDLVLFDVCSKKTKDPLAAARRLISALHVPVLCMMEYDSLELLKQWEAGEPVEFLLKPCEEWELLSCIKTALDYHSAHRRKMKGHHRKETAS